VDTKDEEEEDEDEWAETEDRSSVTTMCNQDTWQGIVIILSLHAAIAARLTML
jgi:hypothetical protein